MEPGSSLLSADVYDDARLACSGLVLGDRTQQPSAGQDDITGHGNIPESRPPEADGTVSAVDVGIPAAMLGGVAGEEEERMLIDLNVWVVEQGLPEGEFLYELVGAGSSEPLAILDLAWPEGLQPGFSEPVAVLLDEDHHVHEVANRAGFRYFTDVASFKDYVLREIIASEAASD